MIEEKIVISNYQETKKNCIMYLVVWTVPLFLKQIRGESSYIQNLVQFASYNPKVIPSKFPVTENHANAL